MSGREQLKPFLLRLGIFIALNLTGLIPVLFWTHNHSHRYLFTLVDKERRLETATEPRIVFLGGSNLAFGLDSPMVEESLGMQPVNMGLLAGMGLDFILNQARAGLRPGDTVVLSLEYGAFCFSGTRSGNMKSWAEVFIANPRDLRFVGPRQLWYLSKSENLLGLLTSLLREAIWKWKVNYLYSRVSFNQYGDLAVARPGRTAKPFADGLVIDNDKEYQPALKSLRRFLDHCERENIKVCMVMPAYPSPFFATEGSNLRKLESRLKEDLDIPILIGVEEAQLPPELFFDSEYHLSTAGVQKRTELVVARLKAHLQEEPAPARP